MKKIFILYFILSFTSVCFASGEVGEVLGSTAKGAAIGMGTGYVAKKAAEAVAPEMVDKIGDFISTPPGIIVLAGIGTANSAILYKAAEEQEKESKDNVAKIEAIMKTFQDSWVDKCPNGREKLEEPNCYCYMENGTKNANRTNSQTCQQLWAKADYKLTAGATDYAAKNSLDTQGCVAVTGKFDSSCQCKKMLDNSGNNACLKSGLFNVASNPLGMGYLTGSGFNKVTSNLDSSGAGANNLGNLNGQGLVKSFIKQGLMNNELFNRAKNDPSKKDLTFFDNNADLFKAQAGLMPAKDLAKLSGAFGPPALAMSGKPSPALDKAVLAVSKNKGLDMTGGNGLGYKKAAAKNGFSLNMGEPNSSNGNTPAFMEKNYQYKQNDIVKKPDSSIFDVISNRYIESGLRRLFEDK